jgi:hypothetical protein
VTALSPRVAGGGLYAVTSEPQTLANEAEVAWELDFPVVGDPHHEIADTCRERGWLHLFVQRAEEHIIRSVGYGAHPKGHFQPGVLAVSNTGRVLYRWRGRPTRQNMGGATERPIAEDVWTKIQAALARSDDAPDAEHDEPERFDMKGVPWPAFVALLLANGNFLAPRPFGLERGGPDDIGRRAQRALVKLGAFATGWTLAFWALPIWAAGTALLAWIAYITPSIRELRRGFQHAPGGEPD